MNDNKDRLKELLEKLEQVAIKQEAFKVEIEILKKEILSLTSTIVDPAARVERANQLLEKAVEKEPTPFKTFEPKPKSMFSKAPAQSFPRKPVFNLSLEKFIGENLINKIGIAILVIGVAIGAKYSIEHDLISPLTRIVLGYLTAIALLLVGIKLKKNYTAYSAVLVGGAMAIMYFITFAAYDFYGLLPQFAAFGLMVVFTVFTVIASLSYNQQALAIIGLVGAYAVPFLLSDGSGKVMILFSYMAIINAGILALSFKKYWKVLFFTAFGLTWLIFGGWYMQQFNNFVHYNLAFSFLIIFFLEFYITFLSYKLVKKEAFNLVDSIVLLANAIVFYAIGYNLIVNRAHGDQYLGLFTVCNAVIHFGVSLLIKRHKMQQTNFFYLVLALVFAFVTIAVPVQLNGNWVTLLWTIMATLLFWIGRGKRILIYEQLSYVVMFLAFGSLLQDWLNNPYQYEYSKTAIEFTPVLNIGFLTAFISVLAFGFIYYTHVNKSREFLSRKTAIGLNMALPAITLFMLYFTFRFEIGNYFSTLFNNTSVSVIDPEFGSEVNQYNHNLLNLEIVWIFIYSFSFVIMLTWSNILKFKSFALAKTNLVLNGLVLLTFLLSGLHVLSVLRDNYLSQGQMFEHFEISKFNLVIRYIVIAFFVFLLWSTHKLLQAHFITFKVVNGFVLVVYASVLAVLSSELINLMELANAHNSYKLGLSILWGAYSLLMIAVGIWKKNKYLRVAAMALFAITLVKLFLYDISHLSTIATTVVFVALGILLLIISFLYNKFKHLIVDENTNI